MEATQPAEITDLVVLETRPIEIAGRVGQLVEAAGRAEIVDQASVEKGADLDKLLQTAAKKLEEERTSFTKPLNDVLRRINARFKPYSAHIDEARTTIQGKIMGWRREQKRLADEEAARQRKAAEEAALAEAQRLEEEAARLKAEGKDDEAAGATQAAELVLEDAADSPAPAPLPASRPVRGDYGGIMSFVKEWKYEVVDEAKVPLTYRPIDHKALARDVKSSKGCISIPGVRTYEEERPVNR